MTRVRGGTRRLTACGCAACLAELDRRFWRIVEAQAAPAVVVWPEAADAARRLSEILARRN